MMQILFHNCIRVFILSFMLIVPFVGTAAINEQVTFYGTLTDSSYTPLTGVYDMVFHFYDSATGGSLLDTSTHTAANTNPVVVSGGEFSVLLGSGVGNALDGLNFNTDNTYIGISIEGAAEASSRVRFSAASYSFNTDTLDGYHEYDFPRISGTSTFVINDAETAITLRQAGTGDILNLFDGGTEVLTVTDGGNVGIGTTSPTRTLTIDGDLELTGALFDVTASPGTSGSLITSTGSQIAWAATSTFGGGGGGASLFTDGGLTSYLTATTSYLALGTTSASGKLTIANGNLDIVGNGKLLMESVRTMYASSTRNILSIGRNSGPTETGAGTDVTFIGTNAGRLVTDNNVSSSTFIGFDAGQSATNTTFSTIIGGTSGEYMQGHHNFIAGNFSAVTMLGDYNVGVGSVAVEQLRGNYNVAIGDTAMRYSPTGDRNVALGLAASANGLGNDNVAVGWNSNSQSFAGTNEFSVFLGEQAGNFASGKNNIYIGYFNGHRNGGLGPSSDNVLIGYTAFSEGDQTDGTVGIGFFTGDELDVVDTVVVGAEAMRDTSNKFMYRNVVFGADSLKQADEFSNDNIILGSTNIISTSDIARNFIVIGDTLEDWNGFGTDEEDAMTIGNLIYATGMTASGTALSPGLVGIGVNAPTAQLHTTGSLRLSNFGAGTLQTDASGNVSVSSDERLKDIQAVYTDGIESLMNIEPITFKWNEASGFETLTDYIGFSAQNVQENIPGTVGEDKHGFLTLSDRGILATVVNAVKEVWGRAALSNERAIEQEEQLAALELLVENNNNLLSYYATQLQSESAVTAASNGSSDTTSKKAPVSQTTPTSTQATSTSPAENSSNIPAATTSINVATTTDVTQTEFASSSEVSTGSPTTAEEVVVGNADSSTETDVEPVLPIIAVEITVDAEPETDAQLLETTLQPDAEVDLKIEEAGEEVVTEEVTEVVETDPEIAPEA